MIEKSLSSETPVVKDHLGDFDAVRGPWNRIVEHLANPQVFFTPLWGQIWWRHLGAGELHLLSIHQSDEIIAIAPLKLKARTLTLLGDREVCDYLDIIAMPGHEETALTAVRRYAAERKQRLDLHPLPPDSPTVKILHPFYEAGNRKLCKEHIDYSYVTELPPSWEDYLNMLSRKDRHELRRKIKRLQNAGEVKFSSAESSQNNMDDFFHLFLQKEQKASFLSQKREYFFRELASELGALGWLKLYFLELDGERVATTLCFHYSGILSLYNSGFNPSYAHLSVGLICKAWTILEAIKMGLKKFDFLRGAEDYKDNLGGKPLKVYRYVIDPE